MNDLYIFLNTRVENSGAFAWIGDKGLMPFRYLCNGKTIRIEPRDSDGKIEIRRVDSFSKASRWYSYGRYKCDNLKSISIRMVKATVAVALLIPGLLCGVTFKAIAYAFSDVREKHALAKEQLIRVNRTIGSESNPITSYRELRTALWLEFNSDPKHHLTNALIIHGDGNLKIDQDPDGGILVFNPMKLILVGAKIVDQSSLSGDPLDAALYRTGKWEVSDVRFVTPLSDPNGSRATVHHVSSIDDALKAIAPRRGWTSCKRYHQIFTLARTQTA